MPIELRNLDQEFLVPAFELSTKVFIQGSTLHKALGIGLAEYREYLRYSFEEMIEENLSVIAIDQTTNELLGCLIVTDFHKAVHSGSTTNEKFLPLAALTNSLCERYQKRRTVEPGETILVDMGAVNENAAGKGVYQQMRDYAQTEAKNKGFKRVVGELSSATTQHVVLNKLGHEKIAEVAYHGFKFGQTYPFRSITNPPSIILAEGKL